MLKYCAIPEPMTIGRNISVVPPAHYLRYNLKKAQRKSRSIINLNFPAINNNIRLMSSTLFCSRSNRVYANQPALQRYHPAILINGGIDSSLYASYLHEFKNGERLHGINCAFGEDDPEFPYAQRMAEKVKAHFHVGKMEQKTRCHF